MNIDKVFSFTILQVDINFDKTQDEINFKNEYMEIQNKIDKEISK